MHVCLILILIVTFFKEQGEFLALDLGGSNFRVLLVKVNANGELKVEMKSQIFAIPEHIMRGSGSEVSSHVVDVLCGPVLVPGPDAIQVL